MLERILYQSTPSQEFGSLALFKLLTDAQHRNAQLQITGHLLFVNGQFTQCMEGPPDSIELLWQTIQRDPRHQDIQLLMRRATDKRRFPEWSMAFSSYAHFNKYNIAGFFPVDQDGMNAAAQRCAAV